MPKTNTFQNFKLSDTSSTSDDDSAGSSNHYRRASWEEVDSSDEESEELSEGSVEDEIIDDDDDDDEIVSAESDGGNNNSSSETTSGSSGDTSEDSSDVIDLQGLPITADSVVWGFGLDLLQTHDVEDAGKGSSSARCYGPAGDTPKSIGYCNGFNTFYLGYDDDGVEEIDDDFGEKKAANSSSLLSQHPWHVAEREEKECPQQRRLSALQDDGFVCYTSKTVPPAALQMQPYQSDAAEDGIGSGEIISESGDIVSAQPIRAPKLSSPTTLPRTDSQSSIRSRLSRSVRHNKAKQSNIVPYSGGNGLTDPLGINWTGKDKPDIKIKKKKKKLSEDADGDADEKRSNSSSSKTPSTRRNGVRERNLQKLRRSTSQGSIFGESDAGDDEEEEGGSAARDNLGWYRGVTRGAHRPYETSGREETRQQREKRLEREWKEKQKELKKEKSAEKGKVAARGYFSYPKF